MVTLRLRGRAVLPEPLDSLGSILFILFPNTSHSQCAVVSSHQAPSHRNLIWPQFPDLPYRRPKGGSYFAFLYRHFLSLKTEGPASRPLTRRPAAVRQVVVIFEVIPSQQWVIIRYYIGV